MRKDEFQIKIPSSAQYVGIVRLALSGIASKMNFPVDEIDEIKTAVSEACNNVIQHAYEESHRCKEITIDCRMHKDRLDITVGDQGKGFKPSTLKHQAKLGVTFMNNMMDVVEFKSHLNKGTKVHLVKFLPERQLKH
jgi:serine/threonine-protein kinase RsbW